MRKTEVDDLREHFSEREDLKEITMDLFPFSKHSKQVGLIN